MSLPQAKKRYTPAEYYERERAAPYKSDFYDGEIFAMAGGTAAHSLISTNIAGELRQRLKGKPCAAYESNLRLKVRATGLRTYPDVSVYCGALAYDADDPGGTTALNPTVVFEVLSPSTEGYDRGLKAQHYRRIESLRAYVLVAQDRAQVEVHQRQPGGPWEIGDAGGLESSVRLDALGIDLPLAEVYDRVEFPAVPPSTIPPA